ncbi:hypothetical protein AQUCO_06300004v1 [Aquilegia coerulea]|uniref:Trehalose-phosphatase n=1 Tax=Aquilegia coerulea TaxID=218851 RepID=A0A2G5CCP3_AQUCA|nr:hypothetical protein AQUCO_06300004v1 [Aquilegia coerulea]
MAVIRTVCIPNGEGLHVNYMLLILFSFLVKVLDVRLVIDWDKGKAVEFLLDSPWRVVMFNLLLTCRILPTSFLIFKIIPSRYILLSECYKFGAGLSESDDVLPIYVGDDRTDEDVFKVNTNTVLEP